MRRIGILVAGVALIAGCSSGSGGGHKTSASAPSPADRSGYVSAVRGLYPSSNTATDLLRTGDADCHGLSTGVTAATLVDTLGGSQLGAERTRAKATVTAAIEHLCPQFKNQLPIKD